MPHALPGPASLPSPRPNLSLEDWETVANRLMLAYVRKRLSINPRAWGAFSEYGQDPFASAQARSTRIAVAYKHAFARDMAERLDFPSSAETRTYFAECMARAESQIAATLA
jgi:hypothetical protein